MTKKQSLFIVGYKRSGTTLLARLLNLHPDIYVANEADAVWLIYQLKKGISPLKPYRNDSPAGLVFSRDKYASRLNLAASFTEIFQQLIDFHNTEGSINFPAQNKNHIEVLGDQKPMQHSDPKLIETILNELPNPIFVHIHRHPFEVVRSCEKFGNESGGFIWNKQSSTDILTDWLYYENRFWKEQEKHRFSFVSISYDDLISNTEFTIGKIIKSLKLQTMPNIESEAIQIAAKVYPKNNYPVSDALLRQMEAYHYKPYSFWESSRASYWFRKISKELSRFKNL